MKHLIIERAPVGWILREDGKAVGAYRTRALAEQRSRQKGLCAQAAGTAYCVSIHPTGGDLRVIRIYDPKKAMRRLTDLMP